MLDFSGVVLRARPHIPEDRALTADTTPSHAADAPRAPGDQRASDATLALILNSLDEDKAEDIVQIDLRGKSSVADHMVVCSGRSTRQVTSIAEKLSERLKDTLGRTARTEGKTQGDWVLLDAGDVIVHIFRPEVREFYQLEKMWQDPSAAQAARPI
ncbi:ribosome silencing factor [Jannaschia rubra]|uniref:ribosome silencing factor n=1 Tax=Jannaschia rubra TaxID=282197 RepID=UPI0035213BBB